MWIYGYVASFVQANLLISSALSGFVAQPSRPRSEICATMSPYEFRTKEAQNARKSPQTAHFCSALPCIVVCVAAQCRHAYSCNKIRRNHEFYHLSPNCRILRSLPWLAYLVAFVLKSAHRAFLWLTRGCLRQKEKSIEAVYPPSLIASQLLDTVASYISYFFSVSNSLALFNLLMDKNFRSHPEGIFTLFQKRNEMVHIACPRTVFSVAVILLDKTLRFQSLER